MHAGRLVRIDLRPGARAARVDRNLARRLLGVLKTGRVPVEFRPDTSGLSSFARKVLELCGRIRPGRVMSYGELARIAGRPNAARAVGRILAGNPFPLVVPCHRVVGADGRLTGYGGGLAMKEALLQAEGWSFAGKGRARRVQR